MNITEKASKNPYQEAYYRERSAREHAEATLEDKARELYKINEALKFKQNQLIISEKMASLGQISAGIAHEINNPHSFIMSNTNTLIDYINDIFDFFNFIKNEMNQNATVVNDNLLQLKNKIDAMWMERDYDYILSDITSILHENEEGLIRIRRIVEGLKGFSHSADNKSQHVNIQKCIETVLKVVQNELREKCKICLDVNPELTVEGYQDQISQVFMNIIINAVQSIQEMGQINITAQLINQGVMISIQDNGCGISPENLKKLFTPFFTTKEVGVGTGLGLSLCYEIVKAHNGTIEVESEKDKGTVFKIWLPIAIASTTANETLTNRLMNG